MIMEGFWEKEIKEEIQCIYMSMHQYLNNLNRRCVFKLNWQVFEINILKIQFYKTCKLSHSKNERWKETKIYRTDLSKFKKLLWRDRNKQMACSLVESLRTTCHRACHTAPRDCPRDYVTWPCANTNQLR